MTKKMATRTFKEPYECVYGWADDCYVQCGGDGIVLTDSSIEDAIENPLEAAAAIVGEETKIKHYRTAFFEAFPRNPNTFIRGEGATIKDAEDAAWSQYQRILNCTKHEFEKRGYTNGVGFCKYCKMSNIKAFEPEKEG